MIWLEDKVKIVANLEDHEGYKKGQVVEVIAIDDDGYLTVEGSDGTQWYVGEEEVKLFKQGSRKFAKGSNVRKNASFLSDKEILKFISSNKSNYRSKEDFINELNETIGALNLFPSENKNQIAFYKKVKSNLESSPKYAKGSTVSVGTTLKGGFKFHNLSSGDKVIYGKKELRVSSVGQDHLFALDKFGKQYKITSINDIKPSEELSKKLGILANGGGVGIDMFEIWENEKYGNNSPLSDKDRQLWLWGYDEAKKTNYDFYEWEEGVYGDKSPLSDDDRIIWNEGNLYSKKKYANGGGVGGTFDSNSTGETIGGTFGSSQSGEMIGGTMASSMYAKGGLLEQRIELAKKKSKEHKKGNHFGSEVYLVLKHKTDPEEIFVISQWNYNIDKNKGYWKDYDIVFKTNEMSKGGQVGAFWDGLSVESRANWLKKRKDIPSDYKSSLKRDTFEKLPDWIKEKVKKAYNEDKIYRAEGGGVGMDENRLMVMNNNKQIKHHTEELSNAVRKSKHIPAWVVSKVGRSASDLSDVTHFLEGTIEEKQYAEGGGVGSRYNQWAKNIYENQSEQQAREGLMQFATEEGFDYSDVEKALQTYKYDTEENAWGELYYTKKAIRSMISTIADEKFEEGGNTPSTWNYSIGGL